ncbi:hypothetical protein [Corynebacterium gerontici]|uniref:Uncharacterized protein n=1 Tax=Corynebacterium gerontici TaxID=2079234 RepID=A0A3G6IYA5_9CORY|nr:hypothetical protein [Corynebacterium gerontici]AZA10682.1 hypothetical protein CGERO_01740 [Corynebacterium gerontici]
MDRRRNAPDRLPEKYYQRRRAAAAIVLVIVVLLLIWLMSSLGGKNDPTPAAHTSTSTSSSSVKNSSSEESSSEASSAEPSSEEPSAQVAPAKDTCGVEDLQIVAKTNRPDYPAGEQPVFYLTVTNPTAVDCDVDLDQEPLRFEVYDLGTNQRVWSDIDCNRPVAQGRQVFQAGQQRSFEAAWSRTESAPDECTDRPQVAPGSYYLHTVIGPNPSQPVTFNLA